MLRKIAILSILMLAALFCDAQSTNVGISMGVNFSNFVGRNRIEDSDPRIGMCPGLRLAFPLAYESWLEVSGIYSQQGVRIKSDGYPNRPQERIKSNVTRYVDFLTIPVMWKQSWGDLYTEIGPYAAFAMKATSKKTSTTITRVKDDSTGVWYVQESYYDSSKDTTEAGKRLNQSFINSLRQYDVGACFAIGYNTSLGKSNIDLFLEASYRFGFFSVEENPKSKADALRNQVFCVTAGFYFVNNRRSSTYRRRR